MFSSETDCIRNGIFFYNFIVKTYSIILDIQFIDQLREIMTILEALPSRGLKRTYCQIASNETNWKNVCLEAKMKPLIQWINVSK